MGLVIAQLLFVEHPGADSVRLDVIILERAQTATSPPVGAPIAFCFGLPSEEEERDHVLTVLANWTRRGASIDISIRQRRGVDEVVLRSGVAWITVQPRVPHGATGDP